MDIPCIAELNASAQRNFGRPQTALVSTLNGTLDNTIGPKLIWDCPIDGDANYSLFNVPCTASCTTHHCSKCARHIPLTAFNRATKLMMDTPMKKLPSAYYVFWTLHEPNHLLAPQQDPLNETLRDPSSPNHRLRAPTSRLCPITLWDRSIDAISPRTQWRRGAGVQCSLLTISSILLPHLHQVPAGPPDGIQLLRLSDPFYVYVHKPALNPPRAGLEACGETWGA